MASDRVEKAPVFEAPGKDKPRREDTRGLFDDLTDRKASTWGSTAVDWNSLAPQQQKALTSLPVVNVPSDTSTAWQYCRDEDHPHGTPDVEHAPLEHLARTPNGNLHYVNTEGYCYPRYHFRVDGMPNASPPDMSKHKAAPEPDNARYLGKAGDDFVIFGPASCAIVDKEGDLITGPALREALPQLLMRERLSVSHLDILPGAILPEYTDAKGRVYKTEVRALTKEDLVEFKSLRDNAKEGDECLFVVGKIFDDNKFSKEVRQKILDGELGAYSVSGQAVAESKKVDCSGYACKLVNTISNLALSSVTLCSVPMNQAASFKVIAKAWESDPVIIATLQKDAECKPCTEVQKAQNCKACGKGLIFPETSEYCDQKCAGADTKQKACCDGCKDGHGCADEVAKASDWKCEKCGKLFDTPPEDCPGCGSDLIYWKRKAQVGACGSCGPDMQLVITSDKTGKKLSCRRCGGQGAAARSRTVQQRPGAATQKAVEAQLNAALDAVMDARLSKFIEFRRECEACGEMDKLRPCGKCNFKLCKGCNPPDAAQCDSCTRKPKSVYEFKGADHLWSVRLDLAASGAASTQLTKGWVPAITDDGKPAAMNTDTGEHVTGDAAAKKLMGASKTVRRNRTVGTAAAGQHRKDLHPHKPRGATSPGRGGSVAPKGGASGVRSSSGRSQGASGQRSPLGSDEGPASAGPSWPRLQQDGTDPRVTVERLLAGRNPTKPHPSGAGMSDMMENVASGRAPYSPKRDDKGNSVPVSREESDKDITQMASRAWQSAVSTGASDEDALKRGQRAAATRAAKYGLDPKYVNPAMAAKASRDSNHVGDSAAEHADDSTDNVEKSRAARLDKAVYHGVGGPQRKEPLKPVVLDYDPQTVGEETGGDYLEDEDFPQGNCKQCGNALKMRNVSDGFARYCDGCHEWEGSNPNGRQGERVLYQVRKAGTPDTYCERCGEEAACDRCGDIPVTYCSDGKHLCDNHAETRHEGREPMFDRGDLD